MTIRFYITIDTEEDDWGSFNSVGNSVNNIQQLPRLQELFDKYGAIPTYLINYPVATDEFSRGVLEKILKSGKCEIGTHCHPWNTPPFIEETTPYTSMMCNLSGDLVLEKMTHLHETIISNFGIIPTSFRAGRWGFNGDVAKIIGELGYKLDTSISPFVDWRKNHGPDFSNGETSPYYFDYDNIYKKKRDGLMLEVPPTIGFCQKNIAVAQYVRNYIVKSKLSKFRLLGLLDKLNMLNFYWLSPELSNSKQMIKLCDSFIRSGHGVLNMSFHSTTLLPGKSPFVTSERELGNFLDRIEGVLKYASSNDFVFSGISDQLKVLDPMMSGNT